MKSGVYKILCLVDGRVYVGHSKNLRRRFNDHISRLKRGKNMNRLLQEAWNRHGASSFQFLVIEECKCSDLINREQFWIDEYRAACIETGFNISPTAESNRGVKYPDFIRQRCSEWQRGRKLSDSHRENVRRAVTGRVTHESTRKKLSEANKGKVISPEMRARISATLTGRPLAETTKQKISQAMKGRQFSDETRKKFSAWQVGRVLSQETKDKIAVAARRRFAMKRPVTEIRYELC